MMGFVIGFGVIAYFYIAAIVYKFALRKCFNSAGMGALFWILTVPMTIGVYLFILMLIKMDDSATYVADWLDDVIDIRIY